MSIPKPEPCRYNDGVGCTTPGACAGCGWHPMVAKARKMGMLVKNKEGNMEMHAIMTESEAADFMRWRQEKQVQAVNTRRLREMSDSLLQAIGIDDAGTPYVADEDMAQELLETAAIYAEN